MKIPEITTKNELSWNTVGQIGAKAVLESFLRTEFKDNLPHAFLFLGPKGVGKHDLAKEFVEKIFQPTKLLPEIFEYDFIASPSIEDLRDIINFSSLTSAKSKKVFILNNFELASVGSVNSLLKTLEEPSVSSMFVIISNSNTVLPTIKSRCISIRCYPNAIGQVDASLPRKVAQSVFGYPNLARELAGDNELVSMYEEYLQKLENPNLNQVTELSKLDASQLRLLVQLWTALLKQAIEQGNDPVPLIRKIRIAMQTHAELAKSFNTKLVLQQFLIETKI